MVRVIKDACCQRGQADSLMPLSISRLPSEEARMRQYRYSECGEPSLTLIDGNVSGNCAAILGTLISTVWDGLLDNDRHQYQWVNGQLIMLTSEARKKAFSQALTNNKTA